MIPSTASLRCWAEVDAGALRHNARVAGRLAGGGPECVMAVIKAGAYGHGLPIVTRALAGEVGSCAVATLTEALEVAAIPGRALPDHPAPPIYILGPALAAEIPEIVENGFIPAISSLAEARAFAAAAAAAGRRVALHVVVDTGMGRMGALPDEAGELLRAIHTFPELSLDSVSSHFPSSDDDELFTRGQEEHFRKLVAAWQTEIGPLRTHLANSAGILRYPRQRGEIVRAGLMLYGVAPLAEFCGQLRPALTWKSRITLVRRLPAGHSISYGRTFITPQAMTVATVAAGYGDGYPRQVSGQPDAAVLVRGQRCRILGRITMDQIVIDVSALTPPPAPGDVVTLLGTDEAHAITVTELAAMAGTIPWHILTGITARTLRVDGAP